MTSRCFAAAALLGAAGLSVGQVYTDASKSTLVPASSMKQKGVARTHYLINVGVGGAEGPRPFSSFTGYSPADVKAAYGMPANGGSGAIAIVDAYDNPTALADFNQYAQAYGLPLETSANATLSTNKVFQVVYANGQPAANSGWAGEIALDIEAAHGVAPKAKIYLVEAKDNSYAELWKAIHLAKTLPGVRQISMSFGGGDGAYETAFDSELTQNGVTFFASSGDTGGVPEYPSVSPNVVGVGGTNLRMSGTTVTSETAWGVYDPSLSSWGAGGGFSQYEVRPAFQGAISAIVGTKRGAPDISAVADPATGLRVFSTYAFGGWTIIGGTSLACPVSAAIANVRGGFSASSQAENIRNYQFLGTRVFRDITTGKSGAFSAAVGWDPITGCGSPVGMLPTLNYYSPVSVAVYVGTYVSGGLADVKNLDATGYVTRSRPSAAANAKYGQWLANSVVVPCGAAIAGYAKWYVYFNTSSSSNSSVDLYVWDYVSLNWTFLTTFASTSSNANVYWSPATTASATRYQDTNRAFKFLVQAHRAGDNVTPFTLNIDRVIGVGYY